MDKERRNNLRRVINQCRKILEEDFEKELAYFGIKADGNFLELSELEHLSEENIKTRKRIESAIEKESVGGLDKKQAVQRYIRHTSFTFLNRIAALRAMEVRGLIKEAIIQRNEYGGRSFREREIAEANPSLSPYDVLKATLIQAFKEVAEEIKVLFDVKSEYSIIFPSERACRDVIRLLTKNITESDWKDDEIIGWIYQYYNDEARREYRKSKREPVADDIPVISQFYTPHWIVKALVDNTLGRLWVEMHPNSKLRNFCTYLVQFKNGRNKRADKKVREIKVLDPACGSGHFLIYAFDLLYQMYREEEPNTSIPEILQSILENNLFGIDIDLFSAQLTALSLYLKAKTYDHSVKITRMNIVCADVRISDGKKRYEFLERFKDDPDLQEIFAKLFDDLGYTFEIGSLLKVREPFERLFKERKKEPKQARFIITGQTQLSQRGIMGQTKFVTKASENYKASFVMVIPKERTIEEMICELRKFEKEAVETQDMGRLLFATEAEKSVGLLALLSEKYDVILMNPPHGPMPSKTKEYAQRYYSRTQHDYYATFIEQAVSLTETSGFIGVLTGRSLLVTKSFQKLREEIFQKDAIPCVILDLGFKTMEEAHARYAALVLKRNLDNKPNINGNKITFFNLTKFEWDNKRLGFEKCLEKYPQFEDIYEVTIGELSEVPGTPYAYWAPSALRKLFKRFPPLDKDVAKIKNAPKIADVKQGLATADKLRFTRFWWEVPISQITTTCEETFRGKKWVPFADEFYLFYFYQDLPVVVNWANGGKEIRNFPNAVIRSESFYFKQGLTWSANLQRTQLGNLWKKQRLPFRVLPEGSIFGVGAQGVIVDFEKVWTLLAILCSHLIFAISRMITSENKQGTAATASLPIAPMDVSNSRVKKLGVLAQEVHDLLREWRTGDEVSTVLIKPWVLQVLHGYHSSERPVSNHPLASQFEWSTWCSAQEMRSIKGFADTRLKDLTELCMKRQLLLNKKIEEIEKEIDEEVYRLYEISDEDRALIERELELQRGLGLEEIEEETSRVEEASEGLISAREHVERLISFYIKKALESDEDGIVPLDEMFQDNLHNKVREFIAQDFGKERVDKIELEISEILGKSLKKWIEEDYFDFHVSLYRRRPIFWQLSSARLGKSKLPGVFSCFLYYHKLDRDTIPKLLAFYLNPIKERIYREKERIFKERERARASADRKRVNELSKAYEESLNKIEEIENMEKALNTLRNPRKDKTKLKPNAKWVEKAIAEVRDNGWNPIIDYGVRVNIEPLKELEILHPAVDRVK
jgi:type I restriction-modification system DNA methylase subunit